MYTKEVIALTPKVNEAIKKIAGKMERRCRRCEGIGYKKGNPTHKCSACNGTGKVKGKWKWEPEAGECFSFGWKDIRKLIIIPVKFYLEEDNICFDDYVFPISHCIPFLHWERIRETLKQAGYSFSITSGASGGQITVYKDVGTDKVYEKYHNNDLQFEVMQAVIRLGKEASNEKD